MNDDYERAMFSAMVVALAVALGVLLLMAWVDRGWLL